MSVTSTSTSAEVKAAYEDNCGYDITNDVAKCKDFIIACRIRIGRMAEEVRSSGGSSVSDTYKKLQDEQRKAESWLRANDTTATSAVVGSRVRGFSFEDFRE